MTIDSIKRYTVSGDIAYPIHEDPEGDYVTYEDHVAALEADRKRRQLDAEEVCAEAYQVVGSLLSDLGIFETHHAEKILDNLSQAKMVHDDVLPWPSFARKRRGEMVLYTSQEALDLISQSDAVVSVGLTRVPQMSWNVPLYTAPQPAESCASLISDKTACGSKNGDCDSQPADPQQVVPLTDERIRLIWKETRARMGVGGDPVLWFARAIERAHGISAPQPAEPVKVPSEEG